MKILALSNTFCKVCINNEPGRMLREAGFEIDVNKLGKKYLETDLIPVIETYDAVITGVDEITSNVLREGKNLKIIAKNGVGYDNIDVKVATEKGIFVTYTPGAVENTIADTTFGYVLDLARNLTAADRTLRTVGWKRKRGIEVWGKKLGIVGLGRIGRKVAYRAKGFDMEVFAYDPFIDPEYYREKDISSVTLDEIFKTCDFICLHCMLTDETRHLVNKERLALMKSSAYLINTSRGDVIDERALYEALKNHKIAGAALDVFETEPLPKDSPLFELDNLIIAPHNAGQSAEANLEAGLMVAESVISALKGGVPPYLLNEELAGTGN